MTQPERPMTPQFLPVLNRRQEAGDVVTLTLDTTPLGPQWRWQPGQFNMLYAFGVGEVPISFSGHTQEGQTIAHTIRPVGAVSRALADLQPGDRVGVRGPFGQPWPLADATGGDLLLVAGGLGMAPLRPALYQALAARGDYRRVALICGSRSPADLLFLDELTDLARQGDLQLAITVDQADAAWHGHVGLVTRLLDKVTFDPATTTAMICGPEVMMRVTGQALVDAGLPGDRIQLSLERNMKCALGWCGHCQLGPHFVCRDGPVLPLSRLGHLLTLPEL